MPAVIEPEISAKVRPALEAGQPVVALESTLITHGMPYPHNLEVALAAEQAVREAGATPATVGIVDGALKVGLSGRHIERLAGKEKRPEKCSRRDIPFLLRAGATAGTTVAATMVVAHLVGIRLFATGGIGGVHRGASTSFDVSADLQELARTPVGVVCSGPKAILDLAATREYLETHGVPVIGYRTDDMPAFFSRDSGLPVDYRLDTCREVADSLSMQWSLGFTAGAVIANPVPESHALDRGVVESWIAEALEDAEQQEVRGKALTPFLLRRIAELSEGDSLRPNRELVVENARLAGEIAVALQD